MTNNTYNGWFNRETWSLHLRYQEIFATMCEEQQFDSVDHMAESFESIVEEVEFEGLKENSLAQEAVGSLLDRVAWYEIAETYAADFPDSIIISDDDEVEA